MSSLMRTVPVVAVLAVVFTLLLAPAAIAWSGTTCGDSAGRHVCIWENGPYVIPKAATDGSDSNYSGDFYPNTVDSINDSVSSVYNYYPSKDVTWHTNANQGGSALCADSQSGYGNLGGFNDAFSSHEVSIDDDAC